MTNGVMRIIDFERLKIDLWIQLLTYKRQYWSLDLFSISFNNPFWKRDDLTLDITILGIGLRILYFKNTLKI